MSSRVLQLVEKTALNVGLLSLQPPAATIFVSLYLCHFVSMTFVRSGFGAIGFLIHSVRNKIMLSEASDPLGLEFLVCKMSTLHIRSPS